MTLRTSPQESLRWAGGNRVAGQVLGFLTGEALPTWEFNFYIQFMLYFQDDRRKVRKIQIREKETSYKKL